MTITRSVRYLPGVGSPRPFNLSGGWRDINWALVESQTTDDRDLDELLVLAGVRQRLSDSTIRP